MESGSFSGIPEAVLEAANSLLESAIEKLKQEIY